jgi:hypothetical protein
MKLKRVYIKRAGGEIALFVDAAIRRIENPEPKP